MNTNTIELQVRALVDAADQAAAAGNPGDAGRLLEKARAAAPNHPSVLGACGVHSLKTGNAKQARILLEQAVALEAKKPSLWLNLASVCRELEDTEAEMAALDKALALDPYFYLALFQKASLLELQKKPKDAAKAYHAALSAIAPGAALPSALRPVVERARSAVQDNNKSLEAFLLQRVEKVRQLNADQPQNRFDDCVAALVGRKRIYQQQPTFMHFPYLPAIQFYDRTLFPWLNVLEAATNDIREELIRFLTRQSDKLIPYVAYQDGTPLNQWKELNHSRRWSALYLWRDGTRMNENLAAFPATSLALANIPLIDIPGYAPTVFFSILEPRTRIPPHTGVSNTRLVLHLPLIVPGSCGFRVGSETREWRPGEAWVFDDTIEHEAWNDSDRPRAILIIDTWNPYLTQAERALVREATLGIEAFYKEEPVTAPNA